MKTPQEMTIRELVLEIKQLDQTRHLSGITYEKEQELGLPLLKEYEKRYNEKVKDIAIRGGRKAPKYRKFRWDERHLLRVPYSEE